VAIPDTLVAYFSIEDCFVPRNDGLQSVYVMVSLSNHRGIGLSAHPFDKLRVTPSFRLFFAVVGVVTNNL
jgi:hypothetical protein